MTKIRLFFLLVLLVLSGSVAMAELSDHPLLKQAESQCAERVNYVKENHARIELTSDGKSFYVLWLPEGSSPANPPPMIVTIHGHGSWAFDEFYLWHQAARERGYGILAIQWWLGQGEKFQDYLIPQEIYRVIDQVLTREQVKPETVIFHGFSRGSANSYAVAALDRATGTLTPVSGPINAHKPLCFVFGTPL